MSEKVPKLGEPGAPTRAEVEEFSVVAMAFVMKQCVARGHFPIVLLATGLDDATDVSVWPTLPGQDRKALARIMADAALALADDSMPQETVDATQVMESFESFLRKQQKGADHAG